ncbi:EamA family transporter [Lentilactobacillus parafarraginis]|nr:DMT family transporter [Lentilactobacillus parafarraginis]
MSAGALLVVLIIWVPTVRPLQFSAGALHWGAITAFFAMVLPLTCFSFFMPHLSLGIGPIISSLELPASVIFAFILLDETVTGVQIIGVTLIILAVIITNVIPVRVAHRYQQMGQ